MYTSATLHPSSSGCLRKKLVILSFHQLPIVKRPLPSGKKSPNLKRKAPNLQACSWGSSRMLGPSVWASSTFEQGPLVRRHGHLHGQVGAALAWNFLQFSPSVLCSITVLWDELDAWPRVQMLAVITLLVVAVQTTVDSHQLSAQKFMFHQENSARSWNPAEQWDNVRGFHVTKFYSSVSRPLSVMSNGIKFYKLSFEWLILILNYDLEVLVLNHKKQ